MATFTRFLLWVPFNGKLIATCINGSSAWSEHSLVEDAVRVCGSFNTVGLILPENQKVMLPALFLPMTLRRYGECFYYVGHCTSWTYMDNLKPISYRLFSLPEGQFPGSPRGGKDLIPYSSRSKRLLATVLFEKDITRPKTHSPTIRKREGCVRVYPPGRQRTEAYYSYELRRRTKTCWWFKFWMYGGVCGVLLSLRLAPRNPWFPADFFYERDSRRLGTNIPQIKWTNYAFAVRIRFSMQ